MFASLKPQNILLACLKKGKLSRLLKENRSSSMNHALSSGKFLRSKSSLVPLSVAPPVAGFPIVQRAV